MWAGIGAALLAASLLAGPQPARAAGDWNDGQIQWQPYEDGLAAAKKAKKPVCLVFFTDWCPHCANYSGVFHDAKVVEKAKGFVMIRVNNDQHADIGQMYAPDGRYIPRTFFLSSEGVLDPAIQARPDRYRYFYNEKDPASLLAGMDEALKRLR
jgi:thiol:disulfide interchange protein